MTGDQMFLTSERAVLTCIETTFSQQIADAELQLAQLPADGPEHDQVNLRLGELHRAIHRFHYLMGMLSEKGPAKPSPHFAIGIRGIAQNIQ